jgi:hypothetical protein
MLLIVVEAVYRDASDWKCELVHKSQTKRPPEGVSIFMVVRLSACSNSRGALNLVTCYSLPNAGGVDG